MNEANDYCPDCGHKLEMGYGKDGDDGLFCFNCQSNRIKAHRAKYLENNKTLIGKLKNFIYGLDEYGV